MTTILPLCTKNEHVIISDYDQPQEWVMQVAAILVYGPICNHFQVNLAVLL